MSTQEKFRNTFSKMHAAPDTVEQVLEKAQQKEPYAETSVSPVRSHLHKKRKFPAAAAALIAVALGSTAVFAAVHSNFFNNAFGTGVSNERTYLTNDGKIVTDGKPVMDSDSYTWPSYNRVAVDPELAEKLIGDSVETMGKSVTVRNWTYTVGDYVFDENGNGIVSVTISNPDGIEPLKDAMENQTDAGTSCSFSDESDGMLDDHGETVVSGSWTDTSVDVLYYITNFRTGFAPQTISMEVNAWDPDDPANDDPNADWNPEQATLSIPVTKLAAAKEYSGENFKMSVSPIGCMITYTGDDVDQLSEYLTEEFVIHYEDGSEYVVYSDSSHEDNTEGGSMDESGHTWEAFNRLADTTQISDITFNAEVSDKNDKQTEASTTLK